MHIAFSRRGLVSRGLAVAVAVAALSVAGGSHTAHASANDNCGPNMGMTCVGAVQWDAVDNNPAVAVASCTATVSSVAVAVATGVSCWIQTSAGVQVSGTSKVWVSGDTATTVIRQGGLDPDVQYQICIEGGYLTSGGSFNDVQNPVCSTIVL
jgi:hypothetical protein